MATRKRRLVRDERDSKMLMPEVMENIALFMQDRDIPFEINKRLMSTPLHLLALQDKVQLCDHLQAALVKELKAKGVGVGVGGSLSYMAQGASSSAAQAQGEDLSRPIVLVRYTTPRAVYVNRQPWLLQARSIADTILGRPAKLWKEE